MCLNSKLNGYLSIFYIEHLYINPPAVCCLAHCGQIFIGQSSHFLGVNPALCCIDPTVFCVDSTLSSPQSTAKCGVYVYI